MSKSFMLDGLFEVSVDPAHSNDFLERLKENVSVVESQISESNKEMEKYTATTFIEKARFYLAQSPPDLVQSAEKIWFAAVYAVKQLYLSSGGIDIKTEKGLNYLCQFAVLNSGVSMGRAVFLIECFSNAELMHRDVYDSWNFGPKEYGQVISEVEEFVNELNNFDRQKLWELFKNTYIKGSDQNVTVRKDSPRTMNLGGFRFEYEYSVFV